MVAGIPRGLGELLDREVGRGKVGVAEPQIDDVGPRPPELERQLPDHGEDVRREVVDAAEVHRSQTSAPPLAAAAQPAEPFAAGRVTGRELLGHELVVAGNFEQERVVAPR